jgi:hypothetical protein
MTLELTPEQRDIIIAAVQTRLDGCNIDAQHLWDAPQATRDTLAAEKQRLLTLHAYLLKSSAIILHQP